jgi:ATP-dependent Lon protease
MNEKDVPDIPESAKKKLTIIPVGTVDEVLEKVLKKR